MFACLGVVKSFPAGYTLVYKRRQVLRMELTWWQNRSISADIKALKGRYSICRQGDLELNYRILKTLEDVSNHNKASMWIARSSRLGHRRFMTPHGPDCIKYKPHLKFVYNMAFGKFRIACLTPRSPNTSSAPPRMASNL